MSITPYVPPSSISSLPSGIWSGVGGLPVFPFLPGQNPTVIKAPTWSTEVIKTASGRSRRTAYWAYPLWTFEVSYEVLRKTGASSKPTVDELLLMWEFFNVQAGQFGQWLLVDPTDCQIPSSTPQAFGTGDGSTTVFQLTRSMNSWVEPVAEVYSPTVLDNGSAAGTHTITDGVITFTTAPAAGHTLSWYGYFYFLCAFSQDDLSFTQIVTQLWEGKSLKIEQVRN
jgi:uncharacterized protein (TIGR02217 family)